MLKYSAVRNPVWAKADHSAVNCIVDFELYPDTLFTAQPIDCEEHGREIFARAIAGEFGAIGPYVEPVILPEQVGLSFDRFRTMLEVIDKLQPFADAIETLEPAPKKIMMRNVFNNHANFFSYDMELMTLVAPLVWGENWRQDICPAWLEARTY